MDKQAAKKVLLHLAIILSVGLIYFVFVSLTGLGIPCAFKVFTGLNCPSCGVTRMFAHIGHGYLETAFHDNMFLFCTWPVIGGLLVYADYRNAAHKKLPGWCNAACIAVIVLLVLWGIVRNLYVFGVPGFPEGM